MRVAAASLLVALAVAACSESPAPAPVPAPASTRAADPSPVLEPGAFPPNTTPPPAVARVQVARPGITPPPVRVSLVRLTAREGEDGRGHVVPAVHPAAIDLVTDHGWPAGAMATTLTVGSLHFHNLGYPSITTMRFIVADEDSLPRDAEVALEGGGVAGHRRVLAAALPGAP
jgi:hypothetical protein